MTFLSKAKSLLFPSGCELHQVKFGLLRGLTLPLDLQHQSQTYFGTWEREHYGWTHRLSRDICTFVDIGANHGIMTAYGAARTGARRILAFEPRTDLHSVIETSVEMNGEVDTFMLDNRFVSNATTDTSVCLDNFADEICYPCFLKVDVDGGEEEVLRGAEQVFTNGDARLLLETHSKALEDACLDVLAGYGYETRIIDNAWWRFILPEQRGCAHNRWLAAFPDA